MRNKTVVTVLSHIFVPMSVLLSDLVAARALAQNGNQFKDWNPASDEVRRTPKITCEDLRSLTGYEFSIITATVITATEGTPEHCRVSGQILPEIRFEVNLPASWNRRLYMFGNGGFAGEPFDVDDRAASRDRALKYGFAVAATDTGHDANAEPLATFATDRQKLVDYAFRAVHTTAETAKKLVRAYYGESQSRAYFDGCSTGGRQGLIAAHGYSGWIPWLVRENDRPVSVLFGESFFRYMAFPETDPKYDLARFDFDKDPARMVWIRQVLDATDPHLSRYQNHGGKIVMYFGWADAGLNPRMGVEYYEQVSERMGPSTSNFFPLFMVPGMFHCDGGVGVSAFDAMTPFVRWIEKAVVPERIIGSRIIEDKTIRTRPLCPYPQVARYTGTRSIDDAAHFVCRQP